MFEVMLAAMMLGQTCAPGTNCAVTYPMMSTSYPIVQSGPTSYFGAPTYYQATSVPAARPRSWMKAKWPGGGTVLVWGYLDDEGFIRYKRAEQPTWPLQVVQDAPGPHFSDKTRDNPVEPPKTPPVAPEPVKDAPRLDATPEKPQVYGQTNPAVDWKTSGVDRSKVAKTDTVHSSGHPEANEFVRKLDLTKKGVIQDPYDLKDKIYVSVLSKDKAVRKDVLKAIEDSPEFKSYQDRIWAQDFSPDGWQAKGFPYADQGKPTIVVQRPDGYVLHRQMDFSGGAPKLMEAVRKVDPLYDPKKDKDIRNESSPMSGILSGNQAPMILIVASLGLMAMKMLFRNH